MRKNYLNLLKYNLQRAIRHHFFKFLKKRAHISKATREVHSCAREKYRPPGALTSSMLGLEALAGSLEDFGIEDYLNNVSYLKNSFETLEVSGRWVFSLAYRLLKTSQLNHLTVQQGAAQSACYSYSYIPVAPEKGAFGVHKQGIALGRSVDLTRFNGYDKLIAELDQMFEFEGELMSANKSWMVVYTDSDGDMMLVGDDPWPEFCSMVHKINIYTKDEVQKINPGALSPRRKETLNVIMEKLTDEETMSPLPSAASNTKIR